MWQIQIFSSLLSFYFNNEIATIQSLLLFRQWYCHNSTFFLSLSPLISAMRLPQFNFFLSPFSSYFGQLSIGTKIRQQLFQQWYCWNYFLSLLSFIFRNFYLLSLVTSFPFSLSYFFLTISIIPLPKFTSFLTQLNNFEQLYHK